MNWYKNPTMYEFVLHNLYNKFIHPTPSISGHLIYIPYNKNTIQKSGLYGLTPMAYSQSQYFFVILRRYT